MKNASVPMKMYLPKEKKLAAKTPIPIMNIENPVMRFKTESAHFARGSLQISEDFKFCGWLLEEEFVLPCSVLEEDAACEQDRRPAPAQTHHLLPISFLTRERTFFSLFGTEDVLTEIVFLKTAFGALALTSLVPLAKGLPP